MVTTTHARTWLDRWDRQQETYIPDREERFAVIADVVAATGRPDPLVVDLGCGPGSLSVRILDRVPKATVVGVDADPLLLGLARAAYGDRHGLQLIDADLRRPGWVDALGLDRPADAVVSTTALHWLTGTELAAVYAEVGRFVRPGGVFVDGDNFEIDRSGPLDNLAQAVAGGRAARFRSVRPELAQAPDWADWWNEVGEDPALAELMGERGPRPIEHSVPDVPTFGEHEKFLRTAGFSAIGTVWQQGDDRVLVAVR